MEICCFNFGLYRELAIKKKYKTYDNYLSGRSAPTAPEIITIRAAFSTFKSLRSEFGMSPSSSREDRSARL